VKTFGKKEFLSYLCKNIWKNIQLILITFNKNLAYGFASHYCSRRTCHCRYSYLYKEKQGRIAASEQNKGQQKEMPTFSVSDFKV